MKLSAISTVLVAACGLGFAVGCRTQPTPAAPASTSPTAGRSLTPGAQSSRDRPSLPLPPLSLADVKYDPAGIACKHDAKGRLIVDPETWKRLKALLLSHDPERLGTIIAAEGFDSGTRVFGDTEVFKGTVKRQELLESIHSNQFDDRSGTFGMDPNRLYAWLWVWLYQANFPVRNWGQRHDWRSGLAEWQIRDDEGKQAPVMGEVHFMCLKGRLYIKYVFASISND